MTIQTGSRLGPYEVLAPLGAGGMGEVYRARDTRLGREVAIKVLPAALASDPERLKRFEREARSASSLNHPNIVTIYDIGTSDSISYIAMELVNGRPLRSVLLSQALPVRQLLQLGAQVAEGLSEAHAAGIVHRDLKPENIMVTEDGLVKILDFGLAKLTQPDSSGSGRTQAPTVSGATEEGVILGTVGYMSPEQATGASVDFRSDQFSFGSILYEMATGRRAFQRASAPQTLAAIIQDEPEPIAAINPRVPAPVRWVVERCLVKEARNRYASTEDLARELASVRDHLSEASSVVSFTPGTPRPRRRRWIPAAIALAILLAGVAATWHLRKIDYFWKNPLAGARFTPLTDWEGSELDAVISSDGKFVVFLSDREGHFDAWVTQVGSDEFLNLSKGMFPELYFSEIRNVGFAGDDAHVWIRKIIKPGEGLSSDGWLVPTMGGNPRPFLQGAITIEWSPDRSKTLYHTADPGDPFFVADSNGAGGRRIRIDTPGTHDHFPTWSPDGRFVYFVRGMPDPFDMDIWRMPSNGGEAERLTTHHSRVGYLAFLDSRTLIYTAPRPDGSGSGLYALDVERRIPHEVSVGLETYTSISASSDGRHLVTTVANPTSHLWTVPVSDRVVDEAGVRRVTLPAVRASSPRWGPGYFVFLSSKGGAYGVWKFKDGVQTELWRGSEGSVESAPAISPDGSQLCFPVRGGKKTTLYAVRSDGAAPHPIAESLDVRDAPSWSPDGRSIATVASDGKEQPLFQVPVAGGAPVRLVGGVNYNPVWSPDGKFILYSESTGGPSRTLKAVTPDGQPFRLTAITVRRGGNRYRFLPGGRAVVVSQGGRREENFWLVDVATGRMRQLTNLRPGYDVRSFDVSPDGKEILFDRYRENSDVVLIDLPS